MPRRALTSLCVAALLAITPAAALADGAGDQQYQDPLAAPTAPSKATKKKAATTAPATSTPAAAAAPAATSAPATTTPAAASTPELPRTGTPAGLIGVAGASLIAMGAVMRRRTATQ
jgi:LPXTG-motif cell wall-anchored protein